MEENQREAMFNAWKEKHNREVKKCVCEIPKPRPTDLNNCWDCNGEIYKDYLDKVRWKPATPLPASTEGQDEMWEEVYELVYANRIESFTAKAKQQFTLTRK